MSPGVTLICLDCTDLEIEEKIKATEYENLRIESVSLRTGGLKDVFRVILEEQNPYICFAESGTHSNPKKIQKLVDFLESIKNAGSVLCQKEYIREDGSHIAWMNKLYMGEVAKSGVLLNGSGILELSLNLEENLFGSLECCMLRREIFINKDFLLNYIECSREEEKLLLMFECIFGMKVGHIEEKLVKSVEQEIDIEGSNEDYRIYLKLRQKLQQNVYKRGTGKSRQLPLFYRQQLEEIDKSSLVREMEKKITFFYMDRAEYYTLEPVAKEAEKRGYHVTFSEELGKEAEIGIYCSHVGCLQRGGYKAKFSVIMLHDMTQGELDWPDLWNDEPWNSFDMGILPGSTWAERWRECSGFYYAHPRLGVYEVGYPKSDCIHSEERVKKSEDLKGSLNLKYEHTILYAPSWENDGKEDDFVKALCDLPVNLLIKQAVYAGYPMIEANAKQMRELHEGKYDNVYYIEPSINIMEVYPICDIVVSDESGSLTEALLFGKSSIAVTDWLIPDVYPPRFSAVPFDYVYKCKKAELREKAECILDRIRSGTEESQTGQVFSHIGETSSIIMDLVDYYTGQSDKNDCLKTEIQPTRRLHGLWD